MEMPRGRESDYGAFKRKKTSGRAARSCRDHDRLSVGVAANEPVL